MRIPRIKDVAQHAGVSVATVSRALAGRPGVSDEVRRRVQESARALNYRPDQIARSLRRRQSNLIGLVISTIENEFFTQVAHAAEQAALRHGYTLLILSTDEQLSREAASIDVLRQHQASGIILAPAPGDAAARAYLREEHPPIVLINRDLGDDRYSCVVAADEEAAHACTSWLLDQGRRRIGVIKGLGNITTTRDRLAGFTRALEQHGVHRYPELEVPGQATMQGGYRSAKALVLRSDPPDAIVVHNNVMLMGAMLALEDLGVTWPDPVDVAGFGAFGNARLYQPALTLVRQPTYDMAEQAMSLLLQEIAYPGQDEPRRVVLPNELVTRDAWQAERADRLAGDRWN
jgi:DNA-binding LacI/PurR family transcriptional regulator